MTTLQEIQDVHALNDPEEFKFFMADHCEDGYGYGGQHSLSWAIYTQKDCKVMEMIDCGGQELTTYYYYVRSKNFDMDQILNDLEQQLEGYLEDSSQERRHQVLSSISTFCSLYETS